MVCTSYGFVLYKIEENCNILVCNPSRDSTVQIVEDITRQAQFTLKENELFSGTVIMIY